MTQPSDQREELARIIQQKIRLHLFEGQPAFLVPSILDIADTILTAGFSKVQPNYVDSATVHCPHCQQHVTFSFPERVRVGGQPCAVQAGWQPSEELKALRKVWVAAKLLEGADMKVHPVLSRQDALNKFQVELYDVLAETDRILMDHQAKQAPLPPQSRTDH